MLGLGSEWSVNAENLNLEFIDGEPVFRPEYKCKKCSKAIAKEFTETSEVCAGCSTGKTHVGEYLNHVYAVSIYIKEAEGHYVSNVIAAGKEGKQLDDRTTLLSAGIESFDGLRDFDLLVTPPSGSATDPSDNHLYPVLERLQTKTGIEFSDSIYKESKYSSQTDAGSPEERIENIRDKMSYDGTLNGESVIVVDDVATTCATLSESARAVLESGASKAVGLVIARNEGISNLQQANIIERKS